MSCICEDKNKTYESVCFGCNNVEIKPMNFATRKHICRLHSCRVEFHAIPSFTVCEKCTEEGWVLSYGEEENVYVVVNLSTKETKTVRVKYSFDISG